MRPQTGRDLAQIIGLHDVIVTPGIKPCDPFRYLVAGGRYDDGNAVSAPPLFPPIGQGKVQKDRIEFGDIQRGLGGGKIRGVIDCVTLCPKKSPQRVGDVSLVLYHKHAHHTLPPRWPTDEAGRTTDQRKLHLT